MVEKSPWYLKKSPLGPGYQHFSNTAKTQSVLDDKTKELIRVAAACIFRCHHCTESHIKAALAAGATKEEVSEALLLAALQGAGTQLNWARELYEQYLGD